eukprot:1230857-Rhodomonas_salina.1
MEIPDYVLGDLRQIFTRLGLDEDKVIADVCKIVRKHTRFNQEMYPLVKLTRVRSKATGDFMTRMGRQIAEGSIKPPGYDDLSARKKTSLIQSMFKDLTFDEQKIYFDNAYTVLKKEVDGKKVAAAGEKEVDGKK